MEHLNYCRQMTKGFQESFSKLQKISINAGFDEEQVKEVRLSMEKAIELSGRSTKFFLPKGGVLLDDSELKALDESKELSLPFEFVAIEFEANINQFVIELDSMPKFSSKKRIIFARHVDENIVCTPVFCAESTGRWATFYDFAIPRAHSLGDSENGRRSVTILAKNPAGPDKDSISHDANIVMCFINALACSNVKIERSNPKKSGKVKSALPFDTYHVLTVDVGNRGEDTQYAGTGTHRSPREHLRRGHIRRLSDGRRIWVNAAVIGAGKGSGVITKDYVIKQRGGR